MVARVVVVLTEVTSVVAGFVVVVMAVVAGLVVVVVDYKQTGQASESS